MRETTVLQSALARVLVLVGCMGAARIVSADCRTPADFGALTRSITSTFSCEHIRLTAGTTSCTPSPAPACAGSAVDDLLTLGGTRNLTLSSGDRYVAGRALRCQRAIATAIARFATDRVRRAAANVKGRQADAHAARRLRHLPARCTGAVETTGSGQLVPRAGAPCEIATPAGGDVDGAALASCLRSAIGARLEPVLRSSIKPSIILILTDDQPASMMGPLDTLRTDLIGDRGVVFPHATGTTPLCAPSRASILTGQYAHNHGVETNTFPHGFYGFDDSSTVASWLHDAGYRTGLFGKYINGYTGAPPNAGYTGPTPYVPPGWDEWHALMWLDFFNYKVADNHEVLTYGSAEADYSTDVLAGEVTDFIRSSGNRPFFLIFAPYAPHDPATPAPRHAGRYAGVPPWRPLNYDEADVSDKARWLRDDTPPLTDDEVALADALYPKMQESLLAVDEAVGAILQTLRETGRDEDTMVVFTTDNGFCLGEHRRIGKLCPYEECLRVPFVVRYPRLVGAGRTEARQVANIDLAPTFAEFGGAVPARPVDGVSFAPLLDGSASSWRTDMLAEQWSFIPTPNSVVRTDRYSYIEYALVPPLLGQEAELYDLEADPYELSSLAADPAYQDVKAALADRLRVLNPGWTQTPP